jgi:NDP-sugar pyrophosphorylase family protein
MRAMILAAGYGTRLWPLTIDRAKPAIPFMGRPLVGYVAGYLAGYGFEDVVVNLHHRPESVREALGDGSRFGARLHYVEEPEILGTGGAIVNARGLLDDDSTGAFVVVNGKIATDINLASALDTHRREGALATLVLRPNLARERYSVVNTRGRFVTGFGGHPASDSFSVVAPLMFTGIQVLDRRVFDLIPLGGDGRAIFSHTVTDVYLPAIKRGERIAAHIAGGYWHELSTVRRYLDTSVGLMKREGRDVELGEGSVIDAGADVSESVLWEGVRVEEGARVRRSVLGAGVRVGRGEVLENVAVVRADLVEGEERPDKGLSGEVRGSNFVAPIPE